MFVDKVQVGIASGNGGNGIVSFRHEIYVDKGGPDGGDGGRGADVIFVASRNTDSLAKFRFQKTIKAADGQNGGNARKHGKSAINLEVEIPIGTLILDENGKLIADLNEDGKKVIIAKGGLGGYGNAHFKSSTRQAPRIAEKGEPGEALNCTLELRMLADIGLVGLPNAGKSSLLSAVSNAHPEVADYPFTTLKPHIGVIDIDNQSILMADIPGLIKGASKGRGLGDEFLRHISRCRLLLHLIDSNSNDIATDYLTIRQELKAYSPTIARKKELIILTKIDTLDEELVNMQKELLKQVLPNKAIVYCVSSYTKKGLDELIYASKKILDIKAKQKAKNDIKSNIPVIRLTEPIDSWKAKKTKAGYIITGRKIEKFAHRTDFNNDHSVQRMRDIMKKMGILNYLNREGINPGEKVFIGNPSIGQIDY